MGLFSEKQLTDLGAKVTKAAEGTCLVTPTDFTKIEWEMKKDVRLLDLIR